MSSVPIPTTPIQPVIYDMALFAHALLRLNELEVVQPGDPRFWDRESYLTTALIKARTLSEFDWHVSRDGARMTVADQSFGQNKLADHELSAELRSLWETLSNSVGHLGMNRWQKVTPNPNVDEVREMARNVLRRSKDFVDPFKPTLTGHAALWYSEFEGFYRQLYGG